MMEAATSAAAIHRRCQIYPERNQTGFKRTRKAESGIAALLKSFIVVNGPFKPANLHFEILEEVSESSGTLQG